MTRDHRPPGALEPVEASVREGGQDEPRRRAEWVAGGLLVLFFVDLVLIRITWQPLAEADDQLLDAAHSAAVDNQAVVTGSEWISVLGSTPVRWTLIAVLGAVLWRKGMPRAAAFVVGVELLGTLLNNIVKLSVDRLRPALPDPVATAPGASFPSGHAMNSMTCYALVASAVLFSGLVTSRRWRMALTIALIALPLCVGVTRVLLGVHYPSDVVGGWALGLGFVAIATALVRPWRRDPAGQRRQRRQRRQRAATA